MKLDDMLLSYNLIEIPHREILFLTFPIYQQEPIITKSLKNSKDTKSNNKSNVYDYWNSLPTNSKNINLPTYTPIVNQFSAKWSSPYSDLKKWLSDMTSAYKRLGLNDNAIKNLIAKNSLESSWGASAQGDYNFGNITAGKSWTGRIVEGNDKDKNGKPIKLKFRAYDSLDDFVKDEILFLTRLYDFDQNNDLSTFLNKLQGGNKGKRKYAEDPSYKNKVKQIFNKYLIG